MVFVVLPVHNRMEITRRFLQCLVRQTLSEHHLVLVDDGCTDGTAGYAREVIPDVSIIRGDGNLWWGGSLQRGYQFVRCASASPDDVVLFANDDVLFDEDFLHKGVCALRDRPRTLILAQCLDLGTGALRDSGVHVDWSHLTFRQAISPHEITCLSTRGLFLRVSDMLEIGGFHPVLLPHYLSDYEFSIRARRKGMKLCTVPSVQLWSPSGASGVDPFRARTLRKAVAEVFSPRYHFNPLYQLSFVRLACPRRWRLRNMVRVVLRAGKDLLRLWLVAITR